MEHFDVAVIGSGGGLKPALPAAGMGLKTALIDPGPLGGTCLNRGCIPSKILIHPADVLMRFREAGRLNIRAAEPIIDFGALMQRMQTDVRLMVDQLEQRIGSAQNLTWFRQNARFIEPRVLELDGSGCITADRIFIATGSIPAIPPIPGLAQTPYMTSTDALSLKTLPKKLLILGAGYIACELGHAFSAFGTQVHYLVRSRFLRPEDNEVQRLFQESFSRRHKVHHGVPVSVRYSGGQFRVLLGKADGTTEELTADALLAASGVTPNTAALNLSTAGIGTDDRGFIQVDDCLRTSAKGVYALGDCVGRYLFRHSVNREGEYLVRTVLRGEKQVPMDYGPMPHGVFTVPEIAAAGDTEEMLQSRQIPYVAGRAFYRDSNAGLARQTSEGFVKILVHRITAKILGVHIIGEDACTLIQGVLPLMYQDGVLQQLLQTVYIHPALPELIRDAARDASEQLVRTTP